jgi:hypothetical protein
MNFAQLLSNIHWIPVIVVSAVSIILSAAWHIPAFLKLLWQEGINPTSAEPPVNIPLVLGVAAILYFINIAGLGAVVAGQGRSLRGFVLSGRFSTGRLVMVQ